MDRKRLLADLKKLIDRVEADLRERAEPRGAWPEFHERLTAEYEKARKAERTAVTFEEWRGEQIAQKAAAWILSCVFARFLEDNALVDPPRISGTGDRLRRARDEHELFFREHPKETDREYLLATFEGIRALPAGEEIFGPHNAIHLFPGWLGGDMAGELLAFFQRIDPETGELVHDFTDPEWDTRFLADLYQDLSELAKKKYALLQTPDFVEAFILDRTLEPAIEEFGLNAAPVKGRGGEALTGPGFRMIDPACGPGHFLLGAFDRILDRWQRREPATSVVELVNRALGSVHGVDINPFAVGIAKFRLLLRAMAACGRRRLADCPNFSLNLACGDSLLHGEGFLHQESLPLETETGISHWYETEDWDALRRILRIGAYHAVVANPPYITVKDKAVNRACRVRYPEVC
ncbi:MAG: BREX-2 system adenine-specific DNA-methyltransferase PglX, partial [Desulfococcaceae bacterium]